MFELQLTPHAIVELEAEEEVEGEAQAGSIGDGMEWGSVVLGVCERDCVVGSGGGDDDDDDEDGVVRYYEEWVGVQWEELVARPSGGR